MLSKTTTTWVVGLVSLVWAINFFGGIALPNYKPDQAINGIFMAIVGGALALGRKGPPPDDKGNGDAAGPEAKGRHREETKDEER